jgi:hypothetical protein
MILKFMQLALLQMPQPALEGMHSLSASQQRPSSSSGCNESCNGCATRAEAWAAFLLQAKASQQQGTLVHRELHKQAYNDALVQRYQHLPDVRRIQRHRHLPTPLYKVSSLLLPFPLILTWCSPISFACPVSVPFTIIMKASSAAHKCSASCNRQ